MRNSTTGMICLAAARIGRGLHAELGVAGERLQVKRAIQLRDIMTSLGPAYIKLGQALSIRPDLLSPAAMNELQKLCDKVRPPPRPGAIHSHTNI